MNHAGFTTITFKNKNSSKTSMSPRYGRAAYLRLGAIFMFKGREQCHIN